MYVHMYVVCTVDKSAMPLSAIPSSSSKTKKYVPLYVCNHTYFLMLTCVHRYYICKYLYYTYNNKRNF